MPLSRVIWVITNEQNKNKTYRTNLIKEFDFSFFYDIVEEGEEYEHFARSKQKLES